jgi:hypothetical protein
VPLADLHPHLTGDGSDLVPAAREPLDQVDDWRESSRWVLRSGETVLGVLAPNYSGLKRNGWSGTVHETSVRTERRPTRETAAVTLADSWLRQVTAKPQSVT